MWIIRREEFLNTPDLGLNIPKSLTYAHHNLAK